MREQEHPFGSSQVSTVLQGNSSVSLTFPESALTSGQICCCMTEWKQEVKRRPQSHEQPAAACVLSLHTADDMQETADCEPDAASSCFRWKHLDGWTKQKLLTNIVNGFCRRGDVSQKAI